jgi:hypothetical protein
MCQFCDEDTNTMTEDVINDGMMISRGKPEK